VNKLSLALAIIGVVLLSALFVLLRPSTPAGPQPSGVATPPPAAQSPAPTLPASAAETPAQTVATTPVRLVIRDGHLVEGPATVQVAQGAQITLELASDSEGEWHLHGYDIHAELRAEAPTRVTLKAEHAGRFEHELHGSGAHGALGVIEVYPATQ
jgi:plastocyanin